MRDQNSYIYIKNGEILYNDDAIEAREREDAEKTVNELSQLIGDPVAPNDSNQIQPHNHNNKEKSGTVNFANLYIKSALKSAIANAKVANLSVMSASANASANARLVNANIGNINAQAASVNVSANASAANLAIGNVSVKGAEANLGINVKGVNASVGNLSVTEASAGANLNVTGPGVSAFNCSVGGPSASVSGNISKQISFGNINFGLTPSFNIGLGLNLGIPFLSAGGSDRGGSQNEQSSESQNGQRSGSVGERNVQNGEPSLVDQIMDNNYTNLPFSEPKDDFDASNKEASKEFEKKKSLNQLMMEKMTHLSNLIIKTVIKID